MGGLLEGIRVLEVAVLFNGDVVGQQLGDLGADVIKIESPGRGDYLRDRRSILDQSPEVSIYREYVNAVGLGYDVTSSDAYSFPAYAGSITPDYASVEQ